MREEKGIRFLAKNWVVKIESKKIEGGEKGREKKFYSKIRFLILITSESSRLRLAFGWPPLPPLYVGLFKRKEAPTYI